jgi:hypothetical protein
MNRHQTNPGSGSPYANDVPLHVTVDGTSVATTATATEDGKLASTVITLTAALPAGTHEVTVRGKSSGLSGSATVTVPLRQN